MRSVVSVIQVHLKSRLFPPFGFCCSIRVEFLGRQRHIFF
jgi:hypothetical protein